MRELFSTLHARVLFDPAAHVLRFIRTDVPYDSVDQMLAMHERVGKLFDSLRRDRCLLLVDMRLAPMNNDPAFEVPAERARAILVRGFPRVAVLVKTARGALQVGRHLREDRLHIGLFHSEEEALDHLGRRDDDTPHSGIKATRSSAPPASRESQPVSLGNPVGVPQTPPVSPGAASPGAASLGGERPTPSPASHVGSKVPVTVKPPSPGKQGGHAG